MRVAFLTLVGMVCLSLQSHAQETLVEGADKVPCRAALDASRIVIAGGSITEIFFMLGKQTELLR